MVAFCLRWLLIVRAAGWLAVGQFAFINTALYDSYIHKLSFLFCVKIYRFIDYLLPLIFIVKIL